MGEAESSEELLFIFSRHEDRMPDPHPACFVISL
jgi:hypothetical protein